VCVNQLKQGYKLKTEQHSWEQTAFSSIELSFSNPLTLEKLVLRSWPLPETKPS